MGWLKLSSRFLKGKVRHVSKPRILPEMTSSRFAAVQWPIMAGVLPPVLCCAHDHRCLIGEMGRKP
ncbi:MAG TPA: hypothetical protein VKO66_07825 [Sideroxyarcus sp.]|nr:hypothetical protein [Sideroxyarcus sp.]